MATTQLAVQGMVCEACKGHVTKSLSAVPGVQSVQVDLAAGRAVVEHDAAAESALVEAVEEAGYQGRIEQAPQ